MKTQASAERGTIGQGWIAWLHTIRSLSFALALTSAPVAALAASAPLQAASQSLTAKALASTSAETRRQLLEQAIVADPAIATALSALADYYIKAGEPAFARKYFRIALAVDPTDVVALSGLGALDLADGKRDAAQARLDLLKRVCPNCRQTRDLENRFSNSSSSSSPTSSADKP